MKYNSLDSQRYASHTTFPSVPAPLHSSKQFERVRHIHSKGTKIRRQSDYGSVGNRSAARWTMPVCGNFDNEEKKVVRLSVTAQEASLLKGQMVWVILKDGSSYLGEITDIRNNEFILNGFKGKYKIGPDSANRAQISGLFGSLLGGGGNAAAGGSGILGTLGQWWPKFRLGFSALQFILPLLGGKFI